MLSRENHIARSDFGACNPRRHARDFRTLNLPNLAGIDKFAISKILKKMRAILRYGSKKSAFMIDKAADAPIGRLRIGAFSNIMG